MENSKKVLWSVIAAGSIAGGIIVFMLMRGDGDNKNDDGDTNTEQSTDNNSTNDADDDSTSTPSTTTDDDSQTSTVIGDPITYTHRGLLLDQTDLVIRGVDNSVASSGTAQAAFVDGTYMLDTLLKNLPDPGLNNFYEGWLVNQTTGDFISTGEATQETAGGGYTNPFESSIDYITSGHLFYVLTLEPKDNDPAPAEHIIEGLMLAL